MKKLLTYIGAGVILISVSLNLVAFKSPEDAKLEETILVEIYEVPSYPNNGIHIYYPDGSHEDILFNDMKKENKAENGTTITTTINILQSKGYVINSVGSGLANSGMITKIFMTKKK